MEKRIAYNLYHKKEDFINEMIKNGFSCKNGLIHFFPKRCIASNLGMITDSYPPFLIIDEIPAMASKEYKSERSKLIKLAEDYKIS
jgi:hypothetical protein